MQPRGDDDLRKTAIGNFEAWKQSGVVKALRCFSAEDEGVCSACRARHGAIVTITDASIGANLPPLDACENEPLSLLLQAVVRVDAVSRAWYKTNGKLQAVRGRGVSKKRRAPARERACNGLKSASAASALATIPAAVAFTDFAPNVFVLTCTP